MKPRLQAALRWGIVGLSLAALAALSILPIADLVASRLFWKNLPGAATMANHAVLILCFLSAAIASLDRRHLSLGGPDPSKGGLAAAARALAGFMSCAAQSGLFWAALSFCFAGFDWTQKIWIFPLRLLASAMPLGLLVMTGASAAEHPRLWGRIICALGILAGSFIAASSIHNFCGSLGLGGALCDRLGDAADAARIFSEAALVPLIIVYIVSAFLGAPLFAVMGGITMLLFVSASSVLELASSEAYSLFRGGSIAPIPLFALVGLLLAETGAGSRIINVLREFFGWIRGGEAIVAVLASAVFTIFTGANGITILALGGLLSTLLLESGSYKEGRARGLVAASGAVGLLLPPSAAVIVYGINAQFVYSDLGGLDMAALFRGALVPGILLVAAMCVAGILAAKPSGGGHHRPRFEKKTAMSALKAAILELLVPPLALILYFTGIAGLTEVAAFCLLYIMAVEAFAKKELKLKSLVNTLGKSLPVLGGTLIILAVARGLSFYIIDADLPSAFTAWVTARISSRFAFLLALNVLLLIVGCLMDIYSAILVVSPMLIPLAAAFGINPIHFAVIFIMNLCIGFLTPPVGMNLFLASYAFKKPLGLVVKETFPYMIVQLVILLIITYIPFFSTFLG